MKAVNTWGLGLISSNREGVKRYFHFDALGSTRALTDSSGNVTDTYEYNVFGVVEASSGTSVNPYRYVGQYGYYDDGAMGSSSGLLLLGVRYYSPAHGRFWSWDPVPNLNLYAYVNNSATMWVDPSGRDIFDCMDWCHAEYLEDMAECARDHARCRKRWWWVPYLCNSRLAVCLGEAYAEFQKCLACCEIDRDPCECVDDGEHSENCPGSGTYIRRIWPENLAFAPVAPEPYLP